MRRLLSLTLLTLLGTLPASAESRLNYQNRDERTTRIFNLGTEKVGLFGRAMVRHFYGSGGEIIDELETAVWANGGWRQIGYAGYHGWTNVGRRDAYIIVRLNRRTIFQSRPTWGFQRSLGPRREETDSWGFTWIVEGVPIAATSRLGGGGSINVNTGWATTGIDFRGGADFNAYIRTIGGVGTAFGPWWYLILGIEVTNEILRFKGEADSILALDKRLKSGGYLDVHLVAMKYTVRAGVYWSVNTPWWKDRWHWDTELFSFSLPEYSLKRKW